MGLSSLIPTMMIFDAKFSLTCMTCLSFACSFFLVRILNYVVKFLFWSCLDYKTNLLFYFCCLLNTISSIVIVHRIITFILRILILTSFTIRVSYIDRIFDDYIHDHCLWPLSWGTYVRALLSA